MKTKNNPDKAKLKKPATKINDLKPSKDPKGGEISIKGESSDDKHKGSIH